MFAGIISSRIVLGLLKPMLYVASISLLVCTYHSLVDAAILQQLAPWVSRISIASVSCFVGEEPTPCGLGVAFCSVFPFCTEHRNNGE
jgi:hypothetical protein